MAVDATLLKTPIFSSPEKSFSSHSQFDHWVKKKRSRRPIPLRESAIPGRKPHRRRVGSTMSPKAESLYYYHVITNHELVMEQLLNIGVQDQDQWSEDDNSVEDA